MTEEIELAEEAPALIDVNEEMAASASETSEDEQLCRSFDLPSYDDYNAAKVLKTMKQVFKGLDLAAPEQVAANLTSTDDIARYVDNTLTDIANVQTD